MTGELTLLCIVIAFASAVKMSLMPLRLSVAYTLLWGIAGGVATGFFAAMTMQEVSAMFNVKVIATLEFFELILMFGYLFGGGRVARLLSFYPGLMMIVAVCAGAAKAVRLLPGVSFAVTGVIYGASVAIAVAAMMLLLRWAGADKRLLYATALTTALINIVIYGMA